MAVSDCSDRVFEELAMSMSVLTNTSVPSDTLASASWLVQYGV
jgi:hypothetical protein